jgi:hypothetical protein
MKLLPWMLSLLFLHADPQWDVAALGDQSTIEFLTVGPEKGEHWSKVWFVVIDGALYVRLGPRAAGRVDRTTTAPRLQVRVPGEEASDALREGAREGRSGSRGDAPEVLERHSRRAVPEVGPHLADGGLAPIARERGLKRHSRICCAR